MFIKGVSEKIQQIITPTPYEVGNVNSFLIKGDALSIVDVSVKTEEALEVLRYDIQQAGYKLTDIEQVILTHHHPDHVGWVDAFPNAEVVGHRYNDFWLKSEPAFYDYAFQFYTEQLGSQGVPRQVIERAVGTRQMIEQVASRPLTKILENGDEVPGHPNLKAIFTPGHALSHFIFYNEKENWAIGGDLLLPHVTPNPLIEPPEIQGEPRSKSLLQYNASLKLLESLDLEKVYPGHGDVILQPNELITERVNRQHKQSLKLLSLATETPQSVFELNAQFYTAIYKAQLALTLSKTQGFVDYLVDLGLLTEEISTDGVYRYYVK